MWSYLYSSDSLFIILSGLYAMAIVVLGTVAPLAKIFAHSSMSFVFEVIYMVLEKKEVYFVF